MAAPGRKFSWNRLFTNAFPNFANDDKDDVDLTPDRADLLFRYQVSLPNPRHLGPLSFFHAGITDNEPVSKKVHKSLTKHGLILAPAHSAPETEISGVRPADTGSVSVGGAGLMTVDTAALGKQLPTQVPFISVHAQRKLVGMLFVWEEECVRWRLLDGEEGELVRVLETEERAGVGRDEEVQVRLRGVKMRMWLAPSEREEGTANVGAGREEVLPRYA